MKDLFNLSHKLYKFLKEKGIQIQEDNLGELLLKSEILDTNPDLFLNVVLELEDGSDYLFTEDSVLNLKNKDKFIIMMRLFDKEIVGVDIEEIIESLRNNNAIDYIE